MEMLISKKHLKQIKIMKKIQILIAIMVFCISINLKAQDTDKLIVPMSDATKEPIVQAGLVFGSIKVSAYDGKDIIIEAKEIEVASKGGNRNRNENHNEDAQGMKRLNTNSGGFEITAKVVNNLVKIGIDNPNMPVSFLIKVPKKCSLKLNTVNNGNIEVENVVGNFEISNVNGSIILKNIGGSVSANTINGNIVVGLNSAINSPMAFSNLNGKVDVSFPANFAANFKVRSDRGEVFSDFDMDLSTNPTSTKVITDKENGLYKLNKDSWSYGKINGGGAEIMMKTMNGSIFIRKTK